MEPTHITLVCRDIPAGVAFFRDVLALPVRQRGPHYAEIDLGAYTAGLTPPAHRAPSTDPALPPPATTSAPNAAALIPAQRTRGVILQLEVPDVGAAVDELRARGATVLMDRVITEWGTESAFVAGPDDVVIEIYRSRF